MKFRSIQPDSPDWPQFLDMTFQYLSETWPDQAKRTDHFRPQYESLLRQRFAQGGRGLFLYFQGGQAIGLANVYISEEDRDKVLNIAEFYVASGYRRQGIATRMIEQLIEWSRQQLAMKLKIEVDKNLEPANRFWSSFGFKLDRSGLRNIYETIAAL
jgi:GNAT superfamily N-acetyltransferase